jgi:hypothetical protein
MLEILIRALWFGGRYPYLEDLVAEGGSIVEIQGIQ